MGGIGHAIGKVVSAVTKPISSLLGANNEPQVTYVSQESSAVPAAPAGASPSEASTQTNSTAKKRRGKRSLMVNMSNNSSTSSGGGGTGLNI